MPKQQNHTTNLFKSIVLLLCFGMISFVGRGQTNLVPNPSFEQYTNCPDNSTDANGRSSKPDIWFKPDRRGAGYLNACAASNNVGVPIHLIPGGIGFQYAKTGFAYIVMFYFNPTLTYFEVKLLDSLKANKYYYGEYYVNLTNTSKIACNNQSMLFTKAAVYVDTANGSDTLLRNPQITNFGNEIIADTLNWVKVSGIFKAQGGEQYLTLGNFRNQIYNTKRVLFQSVGYGGASYYIDDVSVYALDSFCLKADAGKDTAITLGDSVFIGSLINGIDSIKWQIQNTNITIDSTRPGFWVHPTVTTSYVLQQVVNGCFSADTVVVTVNSLPLTMLGFSAIYQPTPSPSKEGNVLLQLQTANEINVSHFNIQRSVNGRDFIAIGKVVANNKNYNEYRYTDDRLPLTVDGGLYYRIESVDFDGKKQYSEIKSVDRRPSTVNSISVYPNPAKDQVTIECNGAKEIVMIDYLGREVYRSTVDSRPLTVNTKQFSKGIFVVKAIMANGGIKTEKLVVE